MASDKPREGRYRIGLLLVATLAVDAFLLAIAPEDTLDAKLAYAPEAALELIKGLGSADRSAYLTFTAIDLGFIALYTTLFSTWLGWLRERGATPHGGKLALLPAVFDLLETGSAMTMLLLHENPPSFLAYVAAVGTPVKWASIALVILTVLGAEIRLRRAAAD